MSRPDLSVAITFHTEGKVAGTTLLSVIDSLKGCGFSYEIIAHIDNGNAETAKTIKKVAEENDFIRIENNRFGDVSISRNYCSQVAKGSFIAFIDGDDVVSLNWLPAAYKKIKQNPDVILHPQYNITFGDVERPRVWKMSDSLSSEKDRLILLGYNRWCVTCMMDVKIAKKYPYARNKPGFGYEDWHFNTSTRAANIQHQVVKNTAIFYRITNDSTFKKSQKEKHVMRETDEFGAAIVKDCKKPKFITARLLGTRIKNKIHYKFGQKKFGRIVNSYVGKSRLSFAVIKQWKIASEIEPQLTMDNQQMHDVDSYNSEQALLGYYYRKIIDNIRKTSINFSFDMSADNYTRIDFAKNTKGLTETERDWLLSQFMTQNKVKSVLCRKDSYYDGWFRGHDQLMKTLEIKIETI